MQIGQVGLQIVDVAIVFFDIVFIIGPRFSKFQRFVVQRLVHARGTHVQIPSSVFVVFVVVLPFLFVVIVIVVVFIVIVVVVIVDPIALIPAFDFLPV